MATVAAYTPQKGNTKGYNLSTLANLPYREAHGTLGGILAGIMEGVIRDRQYGIPIPISLTCHKGEGMETWIN
jgi:hypothetical protein